MSPLQDQSQARPHSNDPGRGILTDGLVVPGSSSRNPSPSEFRTLQGEKDSPISQDPERGTADPTGKYAKYAGEPPDGGLKAWSVVLAAAVTTCVTFGYINAWGVFQSYYEQVIPPDNSPSDIAWIGSIQYALILLPAPIMGRLFDIGYFKIPYFLGSCLIVTCTFLVAECKEYWQFFLAQGLGIGLASGIMFGPALGSVSHWFSRRRGLAMGFTAVGSSFGGSIFPIAAQNLLPEVGFKWTMRIFGFMLLFCLGAANLLIDRRLPPMNVKGGLFNWATLKDPAYAIYCVSGVTTFLGLYTVLTYIPISAIQAGIPDNFAYYFVAIANGFSAFGRISAGLLADRFGALNVMVPFTIVAAAMTFAWPFVVSKGGLIAISLVYGSVEFSNFLRVIMSHYLLASFCCGTYVSLLPIPAILMGSIDDVGRRTGMTLGFAALGALTGTPISGAINSATGGFTDVGWYAGGILLLSVGLFLLTRYLHLGKLTGKF